MSKSIQLKLNNENSYPKTYDTGWIKMTLVNGWKNYADVYNTSTEYGIASYRVINDIVYLQGLLVPPGNYTASVPTLVSNSIPVKYLPVQTRIFMFDDNKEFRIGSEVEAYTPQGLSANGTFGTKIIDLCYISWPID